MDDDDNTENFDVGFPEEEEDDDDEDDDDEGVIVILEVDEEAVRAELELAAAPNRRGECIVIEFD